MINAKKMKEEFIRVDRLWREGTFNWSVYTRARIYREAGALSNYNWYVINDTRASLTDDPVPWRAINRPKYIRMYKWHARLFNPRGLLSSLIAAIVPGDILIIACESLISTFSCSLRARALPLLRVCVYTCLNCFSAYFFTYARTRVRERERKKRHRCCIMSSAGQLDFLSSCVKISSFTITRERDSGCDESEVKEEEEEKKTR